MKKRVLGLLVLLVLVMTVLPTSAEIIDVHGTKYEKAVQLLCDIGILESVSPSYFKPMEPVSRSDAARYVAALSGIAETEAKEVFSDVPSSHPHFSSIYLAYQLGLVSGVGGGSFNPVGEVSGEQAAKMLVTLAGYKAHAEAGGGYPSGYLALANQLGILKGVSTAVPFTKGELALMMYNTLFVIPARQASYGDTDGTFVTDGDNLLAHFLRIYMTEGLVTANCYTSISGGTTREGEISVNGERYIAPAALMQTVGREMRVYYKENEQGEKEIVSFASAENTSALVLRAEDILPETTETTLVYQRNEDEKRISISLGSAYVLYNGSIRSPYTEADIEPAAGTVTIWETASGKATLVAVEEYTDFVVENVSTEESFIYYEDNAQNEKGLDCADTNVRFIITDADGNPADLQKITTGMVVSVMKSRDGKVCTVIVCGDTVSGLITEKTDKSVIISGKEYEFSSGFSEALPDVGENVALSLNYQGKAVKTAGIIAERKYGYLMTGSFEGKGLSSVGKIKLLTAEGKVEVFTASEKFAVNDAIIGGENLFNSGAVLSSVQSAAMEKIYQDGKIVEQLVVYDVNESGEITSVTTAADRTTELERDQSVFSLNYETPEAMFLGYSLRTFHTKYHLPTNAIVFAVAESYTGDNDDQYKVLAGSSIEHSKGYKELKLYDLSDENIISAMVTKMKVEDADTYRSNAVLVKEVVHAMTEDGIACEAIRVIGKGGAETLLYNPEEIEADLAYVGTDGRTREIVITNKEEDPVCKENGGVLPISIPLSKLEPGDIVKYSTIGNALKSMIVCLRAGYAVDLEKGFKGSALSSASETDDYREALFVYSTNLLYAGETGFRFLATGVDGVKRERFHTYGDAPVLIFDTEKDTVKMGTKASLTKGDAFFASRSNTVEHLIVIYR